MGIRQLVFSLRPRVHYPVYKSPLAGPFLTQTNSANIPKRCFFDTHFINIFSRMLSLYLIFSQNMFLFVSHFPIRTTGPTNHTCPLRSVLYVSVLDWDEDWPGGGCSHNHHPAFRWSIAHPLFRQCPRDRSIRNETLHKCISSNHAELKISVLFLDKTRNQECIWFLCFSPCPHFVCTALNESPTTYRYSVTFRCNIHRTLRYVSLSMDVVMYVPVRSLDQRPCHDIRNRSRQPANHSPVSRTPTNSTRDHYSG